MSSLVVQIARLSEMNLRELRMMWKETFQSECPVPQSRVYMMRRIAHHLQLNRYGGLDDLSRKRLEPYVDEQSKRFKGEANISRPLPGTILVRTYKDEEHRVQVLHRGFEYRQVQYKSLTEVARKITGTHCSGPMFFGLVRPGKREGGRR